MPSSLEHKVEVYSALSQRWLMDTCSSNWPTVRRLSQCRCWAFKITSRSRPASRPLLTNMKHLSFYTSTVVLAAIPLTAVFAHPTWIVGQTVRTTSGPVDGHAASVASGVSEYLGIPYAQPPVGGLRFQPPVRYKGTRKLNGKDFVRPLGRLSLVHRGLADK
jgi:hypothetical protein